VTLLHASPIVPLAAYAPGSGVVPTANLTDEDRDRLVASMKQLAVDAGSGVAFDYKLAEGHPAAQILNAADVLSSDFIVIGTHGRSGFERMILGSVTEKVVRRAKCPVLTVPGPEAGASTAPAALFKRIVCAVDFSDCSIRGLNYALSLAQQADAELTVVHVIEMPSDDPLGVPAFIGDKTLEQYVTEATQERRQRLERLIPDAARAACSIQTLIATGKPYREILRLAAEQTSDLIVIGLHGRGPVDLLFFGSTAQQVIRAAGCPVLTLRS
jgi:nucleotide-binding universal stress UspA family protein